MRTVPYPHQQRAFDDTKDTKALGIWWEMGLGKSKLIIDTAYHLFKAGKISAVVVLAPKGVHGNWAAREVPTHSWADDPTTYTYNSGTMSSKEKARLREFQEASTEGNLLWFCISYSGLMTKDGHALTLKMLAEHKTLLVLDESQHIKCPGAQRTKRVLSITPKAAYVRCLSGTPIANSPFDLFTQIKAIDPKAWARISCSSYLAFKTNFGVWGQISGPGGRAINVLRGYRNLPRLQEFTAQYGVRLQKSAVLDLPEKIYKRRYFELTSAQRKVYEQIKDELLVEVRGNSITVELAIVKLLRMQQISSGFISGDEKEVTSFPENPKLEALQEILEVRSGQLIVFTRFAKELADCSTLLEALGISYVTYSGSTSNDNRREAVSAFMEGRVDVFLANTAAAATGLTLTAATTVIYYTNSFDLAQRKQSEDRAHRIGQKKNVLYVDLLAEHTIDDKVLRSLQLKQAHAEFVLRDEIENWLS